MDERIILSVYGGRMTETPASAAEHIIYCSLKTDNVLRRLQLHKCAVSGHIHTRPRSGVYATRSAGI